MDFQKASFKVSKKGEQSYIGYLSQTKTIFNNKKIHPFLQAIIPTYISTQNFLLQTTRAPRKRNFLLETAGSQRSFSSCRGVIM